MSVTYTSAVVKVVNLALSGTYATGGFSLSANDCGLTTIDRIVDATCDNYNLNLSLIEKAWKSKGNLIALRGPEGQELKEGSKVEGVLTLTVLGTE